MNNQNYVTLNWIAAKLGIKPFWLYKRRNAIYKIYNAKDIDGHMMISRKSADDILASLNEYKLFNPAKTNSKNQDLTYSLGLVWVRKISKEKKSS